MSYQDLIGEEVFWGSPCYEEFHTITDVKEEEDDVVLYLGRHEREFFTKIEKQDLDKFIENEYVEFIRKFPDGLALEVLVTCGEQSQRWMEKF
jgi:hypothetical protein